MSSVLAGRFCPLGPLRKPDHSVLRGQSFHRIPIKTVDFKVKRSCGGITG